MNCHKQPVSVLVVIHTPALDILLLERAAHPGFWQSVTGSREADEALIDTARREALEETGLDAALFKLCDWQQSSAFEIFPEWRHRYAPGVTQNIEHVFSLEVPARQTITIAPNEHVAYEWLPWQEAAERCFSWSNRDAILSLAKGFIPPG
ncbi:MAG: dihydroneopterin triphosphate diphosphatase [Azonexus sp.]|nr:dihydroneopterin triphosphate diphosphatase [Azonexus sp.]MDP3637746.1 dihydroneopterin triphosphate diphosphatase [Azonexus sp.]MDZ4316173.1 dihydroneopterin triphosphate diphosphatase [Azonexus sp.]